MLPYPKVLVLDAETELIAPGVPAPASVLWAFARATGDAWLELPAQAHAIIREALLDEDTVLIGHNIVYDLGVFVNEAGCLDLVYRAYDQGRIRCTQVAQQIADIARGQFYLVRNDGSTGYALADLEQGHLGRDRTAEKKGDDVWRTRYAELRGMALAEMPQDAKDYALRDAIGTRDVRASQIRRYGDVQPGERENLRQAWALHRMSMAGLRTDPQAVSVLKTRLLGEREQNVRRLRDVGLLKPARLTSDRVRAGVQPDWWETGRGGAQRPMVWSKNMAAIQERVSAAFDGRPPLTDKGRVSTDRDTLLRTGDPDLAILADASGVDKLLNTYIPFLERGTQTPVNPSYQVVVRTGRTSCREPNIQNLPRDGSVRECFVPARGNVFVDADYATLELCALAQVCLWLFGYSRMADAINAGRDLHLALAAALLGTTYEDVVARQDSSEVKRARQFAKVGNFGLPGGLGEDTLIEYARANYGLEMTWEQAHSLKTTWLETFPEMTEYFHNINLQMDEYNEAVIEAFGTKMVRGGASFTQACNYYFQGLAAQGAKEAVYLVVRGCDLGEQGFVGCSPVAFVHDEIIIQAPLEAADTAARALSATMMAAMTQTIPDVKITAKPCLMRRWYKDAKPVYDHTGRLIPWEPHPVASAA